MKNFLKIFVLIILMFGLVGFTGCQDTDKKKGNIDFSSMNYVALGDSITYAMDGTKGGERMESPYCNLVGNILNFHSVTNYGVSGSTISHAENHSYLPFCERYMNMSDNADIISVMGGANDIANNCTLGEYGDKDVATFYGALDVLVSGLKVKYLDAFIFFMTPIKIRHIDSLVPEIHENAEKYRLAIKQVCEDYQIPVLDTYTLCDFSIEYNTDGYTGDGVHPSQEFHKNTLAPVIAQFIKTNYKAK